jgi:protein-disulfide isomerase
VSPATAGARPKRVYRTKLDAAMLEVDLWDFPSLGPTDAPKTMLVLADYTCKHCRDLHGHMKSALARYPGQFFFNVIPVPMSSGCNYRITRTHPDHEFACDLARLALAVWRAKPEAFPEMDEYLFSLGSETHRVNSGDVANARMRADQLVGKDELAKAWADPWVERTLKQGIDVYASLGGGAIPKRVFPRNTYSGAGGNAEQVFAMLERELGLKAKP